MTPALDQFVVDGPRFLAGEAVEVPAEEAAALEHLR